MAGIWYRAGTVAVTSGSTKVVGTGTTWRGGVYKPDKGHMFWGPDGRAYEVDYVESDTVLYLVTAYVGGSATGQAYSIVISITGQVPAFSRELSAFVAYHQSQMDGWQKLLTGTGDVTLTAPDGTKITTPSWDKVMNAGYGVVAQATEQAGIATAEAVKAAASASLAANIVGAAALPIPDLWAPLTDGLRLITGYGRDVKVGDDVVARLLNFSRNTTKTYTAKDGSFKIAAVNEPAFEKAGMLIEGQSTNLCPNSNGFWLTGGQAIAGTAVDPAGTTKNIYTATKVGGTFISVAGAQVSQGVTYTISAWVYCHDSRTINDRALMAQGNNGIAFAGISQSEVSKLVVGKFVRVSLSFTPPQGVSSVTIVGFVDPPVGAGGAISMCQLEALPFASSYIPTSGASATRAADILTISPSGNFELTGAWAMEVVNARPGVTSPGGRIFWGQNAAGAVYGVCLSGSNSELAFFGGTAEVKTVITTGVTSVTGVFAFCLGRQSRFGQYSKDIPQSSVQVKLETINIGSDSSGLNNIFCHVRNLRGYLRPLSNEQLKAFA